MNVVVAEVSVVHGPGFEFAILTKVSPAIATSKKNKRENDKREETKEIFKFYLIHNLITESVQHGLAMRFPRLGVILCAIFTMLIMLSPALGAILKRRVTLSPAKSKQTKQT